MDTLLIYIIKVSVALVVFYGLHMLLLRGETFFKLRRAYFLFAAVFSLLFPFISIQLPTEDMGAMQIPMHWLNEIEIGTSTDASQMGFGYLELLAGIVVGGSVVLIARFLMQLGSIIYMLKGREMKRVEQCQLIEVVDDNVPTFSFFHWLIINVKEKTPIQINDMLRHELVHARQWHSVDVMLYEALCIALWWNPVVWLLKKEMKLNLEYLADAGVQCEKEDVKEYQYLLLQITNAHSGIAITNNLNISQLKKRIIMMNKERSSLIRAAKYLIAVPFAFLMIQCNSDSGTGMDGMSTEKVESIPATALTPATTADGTKAYSGEEPFTVVEEMPQYPGGENAMVDFIRANLVYPKSAQDDGVQGRVIVRFTVDKTGKICDARILRGIEGSCDAEALRMVNAMPNWVPGKQGGEAVPVYFTLPILFKLS